MVTTSRSSRPGNVMPIFEYRCSACGNQFELLIRHDNKTAACPACDSKKVEKQLSLPAVKSSGTHEKAMRAAKKRDKKQGHEQMMTQHEYELNHDD
jgi:putative FmdB family regulatory protein